MPLSINEDSFNIKPGNMSRKVWHFQEGELTEIVLLYLHGFTASPGESGNLIEFMASKLASNLYLHRWPSHGLFSSDAMCGLTPYILFESARNALNKALEMGRRVVIIGTSLGASLGLWLASNHPSDIASVIAWSPGIRPAHPELLEQACSMNEPLTDLRPRTQEALAYWSSTVHPNGYRALRDFFQLIASNPPWPKITCPVFLGYYKDQNGEEDQTASVPAMLEMFDTLGTSSANKKAMPFATGAHIIGSPYKSSCAEQVVQASMDFLINEIPFFLHASRG